MLKTNYHFLFMALKRQIKADKYEYRQGLINQYLTDNKIGKTVNFLYKMPGGFLYLGLIYYLKCFKKITFEGEVGETIIFGRDIVEINALRAKIPKGSLIKISRWRWGKPNSKILLKICRVLAHLKRRSPTVVEFLRLVEAICWHGMFKNLELPKGTKAIGYSSDSNPWGIACFYYGLARGLKKVFVSHGNIVSHPNDLLHDELYLKTKICKRNFQRAHSGFRNSKFIVDLELIQEYKKRTSLWPKLSVGIVLSKSVQWDSLDSIYSSLESLPEVGKILIKGHPRSPFPIPRKYSRQMTHMLANEFLEEMDLIIVGNSSVCLEALIKGVSTIYIDSLDFDNFDLYGLVELQFIENTEINDLASVIKSFKGNWDIPSLYNGL